MRITHSRSPSLFSSFRSTKETPQPTRPRVSRMDVQSKKKTKRCGVSDPRDDFPSKTRPAPSTWRTTHESTHPSRWTQSRVPGGVWTSADDVYSARVTSTSTPVSSWIEVYGKDGNNRGAGRGQRSGLAWGGPTDEVWTYDLLDDLGGGVQVDETLVDPHLESVPSLGTLTTGTI